MRGVNILSALSTTSQCICSDRKGEGRPPKTALKQSRNLVMAPNRQKWDFEDSSSQVDERIQPDMRRTVRVQKILVIS